MGTVYQSARALLSSVQEGLKRGTSEVHRTPLLAGLSVLVLALPIKSKARWLAQHDGSPGWLEESDQAGCNFVRDGRSMPPA